MAVDILVESVLVIWVPPDCIAGIPDGPAIPEQDIKHPVITAAVHKDLLPVSIQPIINKPLIQRSLKNDNHQCYTSYAQE